MNELRKQYYEISQDSNGDFLITQFDGQLDKDGHLVIRFHPDFENEAHAMKRRLESQEDEREQQTINHLSQGHNIYLTFVAMQIEIDRLQQRLERLS